MTRSSAPKTRTPYRTFWRFALALAWVGLGGGSRADSSVVEKNAVFNYNNQTIKITYDAITLKNNMNSQVWINKDATFSTTNIRLLN